MACSDDSGDTAGAGGGGAGTTSSTKTSAGVTVGSSSTATSGTGGTIDPMKLCDDAKALYEMCTTEVLTADCDVEFQCISQCILDATCQDINIQEENYNGCVECCEDPEQC